MENNPNIIIYGTNLQAEALFTMIKKEKKGIVKGFVVDRDFRKYNTFQGLPVTDFEIIDHIYPVEDYEICLSFGYKNMVYNRKEKYLACKNKGYRIYTFISDHATIYTDQIGEGCNIYPGAILMPFTKIGRGSVIESGTILSHHTIIGEFNFVAPGVHFCGAVKTGNNCFFGGAAEIVNNCRIARETFVGAAAKVSRDTHAGEVVLPRKSLTVGKTSFEMMEYMFRKQEAFE